MADRRYPDSDYRRSSSQSRSGSSRSSSSRMSGGQRSSAGGRRPSGSSQRPSGSSSRSYGSRRPDYDRYESGRSRYERYETGRSRSGKSKKRKMKSSFYFLCFLAVYLVLLLVLAGLFLGYADRSLKKFEKSQSSYAMESYVKSFEESLAAGQLPEGFHSDEANAFEPSDVTLSALVSQTQGKEISYEKDASSYNTEEPVYDILADGQPVARVTLSAYNEKVVFAILTVMDWNVKSAELVNAGDLTDYTIKVPEGYGVTVNGVSVGNDYLTGAREEQKLFVNAQEYLTVPDLVEYRIPALSSEPSVTVTDQSGTEVTVNKNGTEYSAVFGAESEMPDDLKETALQIAETWSLFNTADLTGGSYGLATVRQYLIPDSFYDGLAKGWAGGIDITFTSAHTLKNPAFENVVVGQYIRYTPDCFSCHIDFDKPMHLTRTGDDIVDSTHSTYLFVNYEGSWRMVDMIADTEN